MSFFCSTLQFRSHKEPPIMMLATSVIIFGRCGSRGFCCSGIWEAEEEKKDEDDV